ncbi:hypothetical protein Mag101_09985 [Microbulbifer agarilyticus]|uniref:Uncharacterized protein n=1 Tax=Microbulbifer agarilyticus TaxID=260552 RepID=A0A1Q2M6N0_9GAMM|nr:hypothetical protein [Microbulbifer agarilyticus]AQQ67937.1 hypothetical protein Mag101_09985 [Microbulbifer agarilyticus]
MKAPLFLMFVGLVYGASIDAYAKEGGTYPLVTDDAFCARVQQFIAGTDLAVENVLYGEGSYWTTFKKSKPLAQPLTTHQYAGYQLANGESADFPVSIACKMKTAERILTAQPASENFTIAEEDRACHDWQAQMLDDVYQVLAERGEAIAVPRERIAADDEESVSIGPFWLRPEIYQVAYSEGDNLKLRIKGLHVEYRRFMPVPDSFMGTHYCTMIAPEYLVKLVQGEVEAPALQE